MGVMNEMEILDTTGHTKLKWDASKPDEVKNAERTFNEMTKKGYRAFHVKKGDQGEPMKTFDPDAEKLLLIPAIQAG